MSAPVTTPGASRYAASMTLLTTLTEQSLDEGYAEAAARRNPDERPRSGWVLAAGVLCVGLLLSTAGVQARNRQEAVAQARSALIEQIDDRTRRADRLARNVNALRASVARIRQDRLRASTAGTRLGRELASLEAITGAAAVQGPAVVVHLEDSPDAQDANAEQDPRSGQQPGDGKLTDRDLQTIVNEVWLAGAEAVAVNDQRLTSLSAIRSAGPNILVAFRPLNPPYDVVAIGDAPAIGSSLREGFAGSYLDVLGNYGIQSSVKTVRSARMAASGGITLRYASVPDAGAAG